MAKTPTTDEALERARQAQAERLDAIRVLTEARQKLEAEQRSTEEERADLERRIAQRLSDASEADKSAYDAALKLGWTATELRKIGLPAIAKTATPRKRRRKTTNSIDTTSTTPIADD